MKFKSSLKSFIIIIIVFFAGIFFGRYNVSLQNPVKQEIIPAAVKSQIYTCSMHPQIRQPMPGKCPLCGMALILAVSGTEEDSGANYDSIKLSENAIKLAEIETTPVIRKFADIEIRMSGKIQFDETRLSYITARVAGRIDKLYANVTGTRVKQGEHLAELYSPELLSAQQELIQALKTSPSGLNENNSMLLESARERLRLWGLTPAQISDIESSNKIQDRLTFFSPIGGVVVEKDVFEGSYVEPGMRLFTVVDLSSVWVVLDAYESDLAWISYGQKASIQIEAYPGEVFYGKIALINPVLDPMTRTVKVRVNVDNANQKLKPEMLVNAIIRVQVSNEGAVIPPEVSGKWICSMHPEVIEDNPGSCKICGMPLIQAKDAGYPETASLTPPLLIPKTAPLITGTRAVVYVADPKFSGTYTYREIKLGQRAGNFYIVKDGLKEGELVVSRGNFKIDSSLQIQGKSSMMSAQADTKESDEKTAKTCPHHGKNIQ